MQNRSQLVLNSFILAPLYSFSNTIEKIGKSSMRWSHFIFLQCLLIAFAGGLIFMHQDQVMLIKTPPPSLAKWYKPENKRQEWLHNMFKLRREMQAVKIYSDNKDTKNLDKWITQLSEHYLKIADMVPQWQKKLDKISLADLQKNAKERNFKQISLSLEELNESCVSCHQDFRTITATLYRAPDFSSMKIDGSIDLASHMDKLTKQINQIKIASVDGKQDVALGALSDLKEGMQTLGTTCSNCHEKENLQYPTDTVNLTVNSLEQNLKTGTLKDQGRDLGTLAVLACARCHGTHRLSFDSRELFSNPLSLKELIKH